MSLRRRLEAARDAVLATWLDAIAADYAGPMRRAFREGKDPFAHPLAATFREATARLYDALVAGADDAELAIVLDTPVRLRAVQSLKASEAVAFVPALKDAVRRVLGRDAEAAPLRDDLRAFEGRVDAATMAAFDAYVACREQLLRLRTASERRMTEQLLRRSGVLAAAASAEEEARKEPNAGDGLSGEE